MECGFESKLLTGVMHSPASEIGVYVYIVCSLVGVTNVNDV